MTDMEETRDIARPTEPRFKALADKTLREAELINCSPARFAAGLAEVIDVLSGAREAAEECTQALSRTAVFQPGRYYRHTNGHEIHVLGRVPGSVYWMGSISNAGTILIAEQLHTGGLTAVGGGPDSAVNYTECEPWVTRDGNVYSGGA